MTENYWFIIGFGIALVITWLVLEVCFIIVTNNNSNFTHRVSRGPRTGKILRKYREEGERK